MLSGDELQVSVGEDLVVKVGKQKAAHGRGHTGHERQRDVWTVATGACF